MAKYDFNLSFLDDKSQPESLGEKFTKALPGQYVWSLFPEDKIPNVLKQAYNHSIEGLAHKALTGRNFYDLGGYTPGILADIGSTVLSFIASPTDFLTLGLGGAAAKAVAKPLLSKTTNALIKGGMPKARAVRNAELGFEQALSAALPNALKNELKTGSVSAQVLKEVDRIGTVGSLGSIGFYSGLQSALVQQADEGKISAVKTLTDASKAGLTLYGGMVGGKALATAMEKGKFGKPIQDLLKEDTFQSKLTRLSATKGIEVASFGTAPAVFETIEGNPRFPHPAEYAQAMGVVGGLLVQRKAVQLLRGQPKKDRLTKLEKEEAKAIKEGREGPLTFEARKIAEAEQPTVKKRLLREEIRYNEFETVRTRENWREKKLDDTITVEILQVGKGPKGKQRQADIDKFKSDPSNRGIRGLSYTVQMKVQDFLKTYRKSSDDPGSLKLKRDATNKIRSTEKINTQKADELRKQQKVSDEEFIAKKKKLKEENPDYTRDEIARNLRRHYEAPKDIENLTKSLKADPRFKQDIANLEYGTTLRNMMGKKLYDRFIDFAAPAKGTLDSAVKRRAFDILENYQSGVRIKVNSYLNPSVGILAKSGYFKIEDLKGKKAADKEKDLLRRVLESNLDESKIKVGKPFQLDGKTFKFEVIDPAKVRIAFNKAYNDARRAGIEVEKFEKNYAPRYYKPEVIKKIRGELDTIVRQLQNQGHEITEFFAGKQTSSKHKKEFNNYLKAYLNKQGVSKEFRTQMYRYADQFRQEAKAKGKKLDISSQDFVQAITKLREQVSWTIFDRNNNYSLTKKRQLDVPKEYRETNPDAIFGRYFNQVAKSIAHFENLGKDGSNLKGIGDALNVLANSPRSKVTAKDFNNFEQIVKMTTGAIEFDPKFNWGQGTKSFLQDVTSFQVGTKIGLGFAVIPNLSQVSISVALKTGYGPILNGVYKYKTNKEYKKFVDSVSYNYKDILEAALGANVEKGGLMGKFANQTTDRLFGLVPGRLGKALSFNRINEINFKMSSVASYEYLLKQQNIALGKGILGKNPSLRTKAVRELNRAGFKDIRTNFDLKTTNQNTYRKMQDFAFKFSRDYQLQKNVLADPKFANDPRFRPFYLFKRFGYRQAELFTRVLSEERNNPALYLRLAASGAFGIGLIMPAKELLSRFLAGEEIYNPDYNLTNTFEYLKDGSFVEGVSQYGLGDVLKGMSQVGAVGTISDMLASESKLEAVEFALKPVIFADLDKGYQAVQRFFSDVDGYGIGGATRRTPKNLAPIFGTAVRRLAQNLQTEKQKEDYIKYRKGLVRSQILDALAVGNDKTSTRLLNEWNRVYGYQNPIMYDDVDYDDVAERIISKAEKRMRP